MEKVLNKFKMEVEAQSENESFVRGVVGAFASQADPTLDQINDIKTAVSEAVTNCIVHAYKKKGGTIFVECELFADQITIKIADNGVGIEDISKATEPFYTTAPEDERSGMGFTVMQSFMDNLSVNNNFGGGVLVEMTKFFTKEKAADLASGE
ncbi:MAG: anti-sigma F factor [Christensenellaceae bacterium]|jgi:stage II sporulation protein AB (anti-sigma F factor)|nr:anti-sigma F factor [Christensenellaceae bacterium]